ncbi:hypothetical protein OG735_30100 [Streptomyces sp. NBC_01210]|uniref:hypothetical protein n=1 Tax=Streptomyces sp. NBC_01210 TaxID=2903774 RepID=UPI002E10C4A9|nr:hypothetical protein OG735_30100 [Streptomyces sp. NBC_01210]
MAETPHLGVPEDLARRMSMPEQHEYLRAKHARPKLSRRGAPAGGLAAGVAGGGGLLLGRASTASAASPELATAPATAVVNALAVEEALAVEAESGTAPKPKVSALAESGKRVDYFEVKRGL